METLIYVYAAGVLAVVFAFYLAWDVLRRDTGTPAMREISDMIYVGAMAFLKRQYQTIAMLSIVTAVIMGLVIGLVENNQDLGVKTGIAFIVGAACSALAGFIGMYISVKSNIRTASAARRSLSEAITVSLRGGAVSGFLVVAMSLLGVAVMFAAYGGLADPRNAVLNIVGFGFGASFVALFAQLGGGIYTKAADVGADLVGKVEVGIPEDDPRNPAVIADLVGDNVGDCAGRGADLFESTAAENIGAMILGLVVYATTQNPAWIFFPLVVRSAGIVASIVGLLSVRGKETGNPMRSLEMGYWVTAILSMVAMWFIATGMLGNNWFAIAGIIGILTSLAFVYITEYYTGEHRPVKEIAQASRTGPATNIIAGTAVGFECTGATVVTIALALFASFWAGAQAAPAMNMSTHAAGLFGTAVATMGMLMTCAFILAMDTFGPITDNAGGITEMSHQPENVRRITDSLDAVGNTTKALTKGYAVGSAALAAFLLFSAYLEKVTEVTGTLFETVNLAKVEVFVGALLGAMLVYVFSSLAIRAVGRAASSIIEEVRRQYKANPLILEGKAKPDFARCVDITTKSALREMVLPGLLAVGLPIVVGLLLKAEAMAAFLMVGTIGGIILATVLNNGGGAWDNAKKFIEAGNLVADGGEVIGKRTPTHAAAVVGDTVGDPYKDTAGPSLHVLVKLLSTITLVLAPLFI
jgi:K(+)-stimulated pyrophosphate-energized sodium pump